MAALVGIVSVSCTTSVDYNDFSPKSPSDPDGIQYKSSAKALPRLVFSSDGTTVLVSDKNALVQVHDVLTGSLIKWAHDPRNNPSFSIPLGDGTLLFVVDIKKEATLINGANGQIQTTLSQTRNGFVTAALDETKSILLTLTEDFLLDRWDAKTGALLSSLVLKTKDDSSQATLSTAAFSSRGLWVAVARQGSHRADVWETATGAWKSALVGHTDDVTAIDINDTNKRAATGSADQSVRIWNLDDVSAPTPQGDALPGNEGAVTVVALSAYGSLVASAAHEQTLVVWTVPSGSASATRIAHTQLEQPVSAMQFSPTGGWLATRHNDVVQMWAVPTRTEELGDKGKAHTAGIRSLDVSPYGDRLVSGDKNGFVKVWLRRDMIFVAEPTVSTATHPEIVSVRFAKTGNAFVFADKDQRLNIWCQEAGLWKPKTQLQTTNPKGLIFAAFLQKNEILGVYGDGSWQTWQWDASGSGSDSLKTEFSSAPLPANVTSASAVSVSADGNDMLIKEFVMDHDQLALWNRTDATKPFVRNSNVVPNSTSQSPVGVVFSPNKKWVLHTNNTHFVETSRYTGTAFNEMIRLPHPFDETSPLPTLSWLAISPKEDFVALVQDHKTVSTVSWKKDEASTEVWGFLGPFLPNHDDTINTLHWLPAGNSILSGDEVGVIRMWMFDPRWTPWIQFDLNR